MTLRVLHRNKQPQPEMGTIPEGERALNWLVERKRESARLVATTPTIAIRATALILEAAKGSATGQRDMPFLM